MTRDELLKVAKPILFSTEMTKAILDGRKSVTRRAIKLDLGLADMDKTDNSYLYIPTDTQEGYTHAKDLFRYQKGDCIYVRETFRYVSIGEVTYEGECIWEEDVVQFKASEEEFDEKYRDYIGEYDKWKPSIHMPKDIARIFLKVIDVRVERLQDITSEQAKNEGVDLSSGTPFPKSTARDCHGAKNGLSMYQSKFVILWDSTIKKQDLDKYSWEANPWVWVIEFERVDKPNA